MCALEFPGIEQDLWQPYMSKGVKVVGISADTMRMDNDKTVGDFVAQTGITFPVGYDLGGSYMRFRAGVESISPYPVDVIVDKEGKIAYLAGEYLPGAMQAKLDELTR